MLQVKALDSFSRYCCALRDQGSAADVASSSAALSRRAAQLVDFDRQTSHDQSPDVQFNDVRWLYRGNISLLGSVSIGDQPLGPSTLLL